MIPGRMKQDDKGAPHDDYRDACQKGGACLFRTGAKGAAIKPGQRSDEE